MMLQRPFQVVTPTLDGDVLSVLAGADASFTVAAIHDLIGRYSAEGIRKVLRRLAEEGIVDTTVAGRTSTYALRRDHLAADAIIALSRLRATFHERLRAAVAAWDVPAELVALFGSAATGSMETSSDIDLFVVRSDGIDADTLSWRDQIEDLVAQVGRWTGNDARVLEYTAAEVRTGVRAWTDRVLQDINRVGIVVGGRHRGLRNLAEEIGDASSPVQRG